MELPYFNFLRSSYEFIISCWSFLYFIYDKIIILQFILSISLQLLFINMFLLKFRFSCFRSNQYYLIFLSNYYNKMIQQNQQPQEVIVKHKQNEDEEIQVKTLNHLSLYYSYIQRYYTTYQSANQYIHFHSNGLFVVRPKLSALPSPPQSIQILIAVVEVKGKKKRGGLRIKSNTHIAKITCLNGEVVKIVAGIEGTVIQNNYTVKLEDLDKDQGYLAIIQPTRRFYPEQAGMKKVVYLGNPLKILTSSTV